MTKILECKLFKLFIEMFKYFWVALIATIVDYTVFLGLHELFGVNVYVANVIGFIFGLSVNFGLASKYVFKGQSDNSFKDFFVFSIIGVLGLGISSLVIYISMELLGFEAAVAKLLSIIATFFWNFTARKLLVFNK